MDKLRSCCTYSFLPTDIFPAYRQHLLFTARCLRCNSLCPYPYCIAPAFTLIGPAVHALSSLPRQQRAGCCNCAPSHTVLLTLCLSDPSQDHYPPVFTLLSLCPSFCPCHLFASLPAHRGGGTLYSVMASCLTPYTVGHTRMAVTRGRLQSLGASVVGIWRPGRPSAATSPAAATTAPPAHVSGPTCSCSTAAASRADHRGMVLNMIWAAEGETSAWPCSQQTLTESVKHQQGGHPTDSRQAQTQYLVQEQTVNRRRACTGAWMRDRTAAP